VFVSGGSLVPPAGWSGTTAEWGNWPGYNPFLAASYDAMYSQQLWVSVVVNKRASLIARLPLKVYRRGADNSREDAKGHPYAELLRRPNRHHDPFMFWTWVNSTRDIYGEAFLGKQRDSGGRPIQLLPLHPTGMRLEPDGSWTFDNGRVRLTDIRREDLVHFTTYNPASMDRGLSPLEPLRQTLENEAAARAATASFWRRGARPGFALSTPKHVDRARAGTAEGAVRSHRGRRRQDRPRRSFSKRA
jgi:HK97 family phage portal protein